jgi:hypothetical protein
LLFVVLPVARPMMSEIPFYSSQQNAYHCTATNTSTTATTTNYYYYLFGPTVPDDIVETGRIVTLLIFSQNQQIGDVFEDRLDIRGGRDCHIVDPHLPVSVHCRVIVGGVTETTHKPPFSHRKGDFVRGPRRAGMVREWAPNQLLDIIINDNDGAQKVRIRHRRCRTLQQVKSAIVVVAGS